MCVLSLFLPVKTDRWYIQITEPGTRLISDLWALIANPDSDSSSLKDVMQAIVLCVRMHTLYTENAEHEPG